VILTAGVALIGAIAVAGGFRSTSARKRAEDMFRGLLESAPDAIVVVNSEGQIVLVNARTESMFGYHRDELIGQPVELLIPQRFRDGHPALRDAHLAEPRSRVIGVGRQLYARRRDGSEFPTEISLNRLHTEEGTLISSAIRDITERRRVEETRAWLAAIVEGSSDAIVGVAPDGLIESWNAAAELLYGYTPEEAIGRPAIILVPPELAPERERTLGQVLANETSVVDLETEDVTRDGRRIAVAVSDSPILDASGQIIGVARIARDITERKRLERKLEFNSDHDSLTGFLNRRRFATELAREVTRGERYAAAASLLLIDLDNFKYVNDTLGHRAGDEILKGVAQVLSRRLRETDVIARVGGDEFAVVLPHTELDDAELVARSLCQAGSGLATVANGRKAHTTLSIGVAPLGGGMTGEDSMALADMAMYEAKQQGRDRVVALDQKPEHMRDLLGWAERLREALRLDRFELYAQPIFDLATERSDRHELLLRLHDEDNQIVLPGAFIATAERFGLIGEIDRWVVRHAIRLLAREPRSATISMVNLSGISIGDPQLLSLIAAEIDRARVDPARLVFEVTETAAIRDIHVAREFMQGLSRIGCKSALDDFGSGFGSFAHLKHLPVDYLKIDGEFVRHLPGNTQDRALVKAIIDVARSLDMRTIAEHVGSDEASSVLRDHGADYAQGYHLGRPEPLTYPAAANTAHA
jgi:diguanylate cyclase (GGDEF)-like protein/PAS domain S-box-containing protein